MTPAVLPYHDITACRSCQGNRLDEIFAFGNMPLVDTLREQASTDEEMVIPLTLMYCQDCSLVQIREQVEPEVIFGATYPYYSSVSSSWLDHCRRSAEHLIRQRHLGSESLVIEIASNDGYMLKNFHQRGIPVLGIDPVPGPAAVAREAGIPTQEVFFTRAYAETLAARGLQADLVLGNNILAHVPDLRGFVEGLRLILKPGGLVVIECPSLAELIGKGEFDTIYHEHHCYFSVLALEPLFRNCGLFLNRVEAIPTHGGSLRLFIGLQDQPDGTVQTLIENEEHAALNRRQGYQDFAGRIRGIQERLIDHLRARKARGERIAIYGAAAKGCTFINALDFPPEQFDYVVDRNPHKQGLYFPGTPLQIRHPDVLATDRPEAVLLLPWNLREEILEQQSAYREGGGRFIIPIPELEIV